MIESKFIEELKLIGIDINQDQLIKLEKYYCLLIEWNEKINLTNIVEKEQVYLKHFYDSLTLYKAIDLNKIETLCDVGTGAGFPGLVLKIIFPHLKITLIDSLNKRITFLDKVIQKLNLNEIKTIHARSEDYASFNREKYDVVTARAVASLPVLMEYCVPMVKVDGYFVPMKANISEELNISHNAIELLTLTIERKIEFNLPIENSKRTIISFKKIKKTDRKYPRKFSEIKRKAL